jgi:hypothetical protein
VREEEIQIHPLLMSALDNMRGYLHALAALITGEKIPVLTKKEGDWFPEPIWNLWEKKNLLLV